MYDEPFLHSMKPNSTVDQSQIADHLQQTPIFDSWLSDELPRRTEMELEGRRPPSGLQTTLQPPLNPVVPLVVEAKAAENDDEQEARLPFRRRGERIPATTSFASPSSSSYQSVSRSSYDFNVPATVGGPVTSPPGDGFRQAAFVPFSVCIPKDEPQTVPCVAADSQKLVKKRERNRLAAQKCRQRKLQQISMLQERVEKLNGVKAELERTAEILRRKLGIVSHHYQQHVDAGCPLAPLRPTCTTTSAIHL